MVSPPIAAMPMTPVTIMMPAVVVVVVMVITIVVIVIVWTIIIVIPPSLLNMTECLSLHDTGIKPWRSSCFWHW